MVVSAADSEIYVDSLVGSTPVSVETVSGGDFCAPTPYTKIPSPTGNSTTPVQTSQYEIEKASLADVTLLEPTDAAPYARLAMFGLPKISAKPKPRKNPPTAISRAFNVDAWKETYLKSVLWCRVVKPTFDYSFSFASFGTMALSPALARPANDSDREQLRVFQRPEPGPFYGGLLHPILWRTSTTEP